MDQFPNNLMQQPALSLMTWNVQGAGSRAFLLTLKEFIRLNKPGVLALVETHISGEAAQRVCNQINFGGRTHVEAKGFRGGIWLFWRPEIVNVVLVIHHPQHITVEISRIGEVPWFYSVIYASPDSIKREELWRALEGFASTHNRPWLVMGDFNDTRFLHERNRDSDAMRRRCNRFNDWFEANNWIDLDYSGPRLLVTRGLEETPARLGNGLG
ncbi:uncharacterized protein LOC141648668 [Silene latifolia]|uniref:uncharacterized protein LOC141648668 n=1 Tax=Silene latifolia TaxID=37657 RepID=UPI003D777850